MKITVEQIRACLDYNPESGALVWRARAFDSFKTVAAGKAWNKNHAGNQAGSPITTKCGVTYLRVVVMGCHAMAHVLAWTHFYGAPPVSQIDHKDGCGTNNRISNLRDVTGIENGMNKKLYKNNTSGVMGVALRKKSGKWVAKIDQVIPGLPSKRISVTCQTFEEAVLRRRELEVECGYHPNHGRTPEQRRLYSAANIDQHLG